MNYFNAKEVGKMWGISAQQVRIYCREGRILGAIQKDNSWLIPENAKKPDKKNPADFATKNPYPLGTKLVKQKKKKSYHGLYDYVVINLTYSSSRMASNRLTRDQIEMIFRKGKVHVAFEPMKVSDVIEALNHCVCVDYILDHFSDPLTIQLIKKLHYMLMFGTVDDRKGRVKPGEYRTEKSNRRESFIMKAEKLYASLQALIKEYEKKEEYSLREILDFHVRFEIIFPFEDGNGRIGRLIMFKECLRHNVTPFILDDKRRGRYLEGLQCWKRNKHVLPEVVEESQQRFLAQVALQSVMEHGPQIKALEESQE